MSPTKLLTYKSCCFLTSAFISLLKVSNFDLSLLLPVFFAFACALFLLRIFLLISGVIQGTEDTDLLVLEGICLSAQVSGTQRISRTLSVISYPKQACKFITTNIFGDKLSRILPHPLNAVNGGKNVSNVFQKTKAKYTKFQKPTTNRCWFDWLQIQIKKTKKKDFSFKSSSATVQVHRNASLLFKMLSC